MLNHITIQARLVRDPELRRLPSGKSVANVSVACDRDFANDGGERETDFLDIVAFGGTADHLAKYYTKGKMIIISGRLQIRTWTDKDNNKRRTAEIVASSVYFADTKKSSDSNSAYQPSYQPSYGSQASQEPYADTMAYINNLQKAQQSEFAMLEGDDGQLPF